MQTQNILVATDFSDASELSLRAAAMLAKQFSSKVTVVHVFDPAPLAPIATRGLSGPDQLANKEHVENAIHEKLESIREETFSEIPDVKAVLIMAASPATAICDYAAKEGVDLIVLSTHGRTGLDHLLIGSVAERVVRHALCPVLTLRSKRNA